MRPGLSYLEANKASPSFHLVLSTRLCRDGPTFATVRNEPRVLSSVTSKGTVLMAQPPHAEGSRPGRLPYEAPDPAAYLCTCTASAFSASCLQPAAADKRPLICPEPS